MLWVTWRHHRVALGGVAVFLGVLAVWLWTTGLSVHHAFAASVACRPVGSANCTNLAIAFESTNSFLKGGFVLQPIPAVIGAFIGPVVLAREFETGTFRYAWTQAFGRWRWALAKLVLLGVAVGSLAAVFSLLLSWYYQPYVAAQNAPNVAGASPFSAGLFDLRGPAFIGWTLAAFAIGALAGMLIRRIVPAIVATLATYTAFALLTANVFREHYLTPLVREEPAYPELGMDPERVVDQGREVCVREPDPARRAPPALPVLFHCRPTGRRQQFGADDRDAVPHAARVRRVGEVPTNQSLLAVPVDRGWIPARAVGAARRRDGLARPAEGGVTTARTRQLRGRGHLLRRVLLIVLALVVIGFVGDRAITSLTPRSWSRGTLTGTLEAVGGPSGTGPRPLSGTITATTENRGVLTLSVDTSGRF